MQSYPRAFVRTTQPTLWTRQPVTIAHDVATLELARYLSNHLEIAPSVAVTLAVGTRARLNAWAASTPDARDGHIRPDHAPSIARAVGWSGPVDRILDDLESVGILTDGRIAEWSDTFGLSRSASALSALQAAPAPFATADMPGIPVPTAMSAPLETPDDRRRRLARDRSARRYRAKAGATYNARPVHPMIPGESTEHRARRLATERQRRRRAALVTSRILTLTVTDSHAPVTVSHAVTLPAPDASVTVSHAPSIRREEVHTAPAITTKTTEQPLPAVRAALEVLDVTVPDHVARMIVDTVGADDDALKVWRQTLTHWKAAGWHVSPTAFRAIIDRYTKTRAGTVRTPRAKPAQVVPPRPISTYVPVAPLTPQQATASSDAFARTIANHGLRRPRVTQTTATTSRTDRAEAVRAIIDRALSATWEQPRATVT